jgi:hypothetical protein
MTITEAKLLYPSSKLEQFEPHGEYQVGDRVLGIPLGETEEQPGTIAKFFKPGSDAANCMVRIHWEDGEKGWKLMAKIKTFTNPEPATSGEGQTTQP